MGTLTNARVRGTCGVLGALAVACAPPVDQRLDLIDKPRVIAVLSDPAEVAPSQTAQHRVVIAAPAGQVIDPNVSWLLCQEPKPPTEDNAVSAACLGPLTPFGVGPVLEAPMPLDACRRFGPDATEGARPRDPDPSGGYYQPWRIDLPDALGGEDVRAFALHRIACGLANAPGAIAREFSMRYRRNQNPPRGALALPHGATLPTAVPLGAEIEIAVIVPSGSAESYVRYDQSLGALEERSESLRVSFYTTGGSFDADVLEGVGGVAVTNRWVAPSEPTMVTIWAVTRDDRGGASFTTATLAVQ